jgi:cytoskeletal protein RodZ
LPDKKTPAKDAKKQKPPEASAKASEKKAEQKGERKEGQRKQPNSRIALIAVAVIVIAAAAFIIFSNYQIISNVPFSTFKADIQGASRLSITATYYNDSQYAYESTCFTDIIQAIAHTRAASTIDFYIIDQPNNTCTYSKNGLGSSVNPITTNSSYCLSHAYSEDGIFLNYSSTNYTTITASRMYIYGNSAYMSNCPVAVELS